MSSAAGGDWISRIANKLAGWLEYLIELYQSGWRFRWLTNALLGLGVVFLAIRALHRRYIAKYKCCTDSTSLLPEYDYIVVGGGSAGAAVAARLSEDPKVTVLLLEAGGNDDILNINIPAAAIKLQRDPAVDWCYRTTPQKNVHSNMIDRIGHWPRGKVLGGCSSLNYMLFVRGAPGDFDSWAAMGGGDEWTYKNVLPYFKKIESVTSSTSTVKPSEYRGTDGPMPCNLIISPQPTTLAFIEAAAQSGFCPLNPDYNGESIFGVGMSQYNVKGGKRWNTATAYVAPALLSRPNFHVRTHAHVQRVLFTPAKEACGVAFKSGCSSRTNLSLQPETIVRAKREVILSAGAIGSPQLLELSGIGQSKILKPLGIPIIQELSGVGENLQDHLALPIVHESKIPTLSNKDETIKNVAEYFMHGTGPLTGNMVESMAWLKTRSHSGALIHPAYAERIPDMQFHFLAGTIDPEDMHVFNSAEATRENLKKVIAGGVQWTNAIICTLLHPQSLGSVHIASRNAIDPPVIEPNYLARREDIDTMVAACEIAMKIYEQPVIQKISGRCLTDELVRENPYNRTTQPREYWEHYLKHQVNTLYHPVGTCKMGSVSDPTAVVGPDLCVIGVKRLRVVDASIMPTIPSGNTNIPAIMIGEKAADLIKRTRLEELEGKKSVKITVVGAPTNTKAKL